MRAGIVCLPVAALLLAAANPSDSLTTLEQSFAKPPDDARIMMRWWWFGPAVIKPEIEKELRSMKEGGIGGVEVQATYPLALDDPTHGFRNLPYLSPEFLDDLQFTGAKARELGLRMDLTLGSGWPYGGPHIPMNLASSRLRVVRQAAPKLAEGEDAIAEMQTPSGVLTFIAGHTRMMVKRPAVNAEGFVLDHYSRAALEQHLKNVGEPLLNALKAAPPHAIFSDSLEVYGADWTPNFLEEFRERRGYDLKPHLPALVEGNDEMARSVRHDYGKTLTELAEDNYLRPLTEWAHQHRTLFRSQTYGMPPVRLSSNALVDLPEGEGTQWRHFSATRWAASANHLYGRPVTSSETWTWLHSPVFRATPLDMKAEADLHFLQGINQLIGHGWPYSPPEAGEPGWRFYAAAVFNSHNPWWLAMPDVTAYLQRMSFLLRQGKPANDVALYLPTDDAWAGFQLGRPTINQAMDGLFGPDLVSKIESAGYNLDFIDDGAIEKVGVPYPILILPGVERIPLATYRKIEEYKRKGGTVIAIRRLPSLAPGLMEQESDTPKIREISSRFTLSDESTLGDAMHKALPPDLAAAAEIGFVHRKLPYGELYFLVNTSNHPVRTSAAFRVKGLEPSSWDAATGKIAAADASRLDMAPYESRVLVFSRHKGPALRTVAMPSVVEISNGWTVAFPDHTEKMAALRSWTEDERTKYYSGTATYERAATVPQKMLEGQVYLNFGEGMPVASDARRSGSGMRAMLESPVHEAAVVYINGKRAGAVWKPPYEVNVTSLLHAGDNQIRVVVGNLAVNAMAKGPLPDYRELNARYGERFQAQDMNLVKPVESGLLGPVRLISR